VLVAAAVVRRLRFRALIRRRRAQPAVVDVGVAEDAAAVVVVEARPGPATSIR
jgi:hypothetical protein